MEEKKKEEKEDSIETVLKEEQSWWPSTVVLEKKLPSGQQGTSIFLARYTPTKRRFAIKKITRKPFDSVHRADVQREIAFNRLTYSLIPESVKLLHTTSNSSAYYLIFEYIPGQDLREYLTRFFEDKTSQQRRWEQEDMSYRVNLVRRVAVICVKMLQNGILHRDLKLENFVISRSPPFGYVLGPEEKKAKESYIRVLDFGFSVWSDKPAKCSNCSQGTKDILPPEAVVRHPDASAEKSTIWALGVMLFMMCGLTPFYPYDDMVYGEDGRTVNGKVNMERLIRGATRPFCVWTRLLNQDEKFSGLFARCTFAFLLNDLFLRCFHLDPRYRISLEQFLNHPVFLLLREAEYNSVVSELLHHSNLHESQMVSFCSVKSNPFFPKECDYVFDRKNLNEDFRRVVGALAHSVSDFLAKKQASSGGFPYFPSRIPKTFSDQYDCEGLDRVTLEQKLKKRRSRICKVFKTILVGSGYISQDVEQLIYFRIGRRSGKHCPYNYLWNWIGFSIFKAKQDRKKFSIDKAKIVLHQQLKKELIVPPPSQTLERRALFLPPSADSYAT